MYFRIQLSDPKTIIPDHREFDNLRGAIVGIYPLWTEDLYILWKRIAIAVDYKYEISVIITDILEMVESLTDSQEGAYRVHFCSSDFNTIWDMSWERDELKIKSEWFSVIGKIEEILKENNEIVVTKSGFLSEWKGLLRKIIEDVTKAGIQLKDREEWNLIQRLEASIEGLGVLYKGLGDDGTVT
ncbi:MAG: hypothetical protein ACYSUD_20110 [Planctomycetota bacterium]|jgi:hypothetical protein